MLSQFQRIYIPTTSTRIRTRVSSSPGRITKTRNYFYIPRKARNHDNTLSLTASATGFTPQTAISVAVSNSTNPTRNITLARVNTAPSASNQSVATNEDTAKVITLAASDAEGNALTFSIVGNPTHGTLSAITGTTCTGTPSSCSASVTYTPAANYNGADGFTFKANDGTVDSAAATVSITITPVNDAPQAANDAYSTHEDAPLVVAAPGILDNDSDIDSAVLTATLVSAPTHALSFALNANGSFSYTPVANYNGTDSFTYKANDGLDSNTVSVKFVPKPIPDNRALPVTPYTRVGGAGCEQFRSQTPINQPEICDTEGRVNGVGDFTFYGEPNAVIRANNSGFFEWFVRLPNV
jgi:hypothetical protein